MIGYYGNSGNAPNSIPLLGDIPDAYNMLILTFVNVATESDFSPDDLQGPYSKNHSALAHDIATWKAKADPYGRRRIVTVSSGGQNGAWPANADPTKVLANIESLCAKYGLDGWDIDLEGGAVAGADSLVSVVKALRAKGRVVTACPEATVGTLQAYAAAMPHLSWVQPQFYNNPPSSMGPPFVGQGGGKAAPACAPWKLPGGAAGWQAACPSNDTRPFWYESLSGVRDVYGLAPEQLGMLIPYGTDSSQPGYDYDYAKLSATLEATGLPHIGGWAIAYDNKDNWRFAKAMAALLEKHAASKSAAGGSS